MGKKMGINTKAAGKKEQREESRRNKADDAARKAEEEHWAGVKKSESSKRDKKKEDGAASKEQKDARRAEARRLAKEEELAMLDYGKKTKTKSKPKVTQAQLAAKRERKKAQEEKEREQLAEQRRNITTEEQYAQIVEQHIDNRSTDITASGLDQAVAAAGEMGAVGEGVVDQHPERRRKAAYNTYFEANLPLMKEEYPGLKLSQYKDRIFQQWQTAPENPMNKQ